MDNAPDVNSAGPATPAPAAAEPSTAPTPVQIPRDPEAYDKWRQTGEIAKPKPPKREASAPSQPQEEESATSEVEQTDDSDAPGPEPGQRLEQRNGKGTADARLQEILGDLRRAGLSPKELKSFRRYAAQAQQPPETTVQPPQPQQPPKPLKAPTLDEYPTWSAYREAELEYTRQIVTEQVRGEISQQQAQYAQQMAQQAASQTLAHAVQRYGSEAGDTITSSAAAMFNDPSVHPVVKGILNDSPVIGDLLYVMGSNADDLAQFVGLAQRDPGTAIRNLVLLERLVVEELRGRSSQPAVNGQEGEPEPEQERDQSGRFVKAAAPAKRNEAPPPTREVSGRASPPTDDVDAAFARNDVRGYMAAANRRDIADRRGR